MVEHSGEWIGAVIETRPANPIYTFAEPRIANAAGVDPGSGIQLPVARIPANRIGYIKGTVAGVTLARIEAAIAAASVPLAATEGENSTAKTDEEAEHDAAQVDPDEKVSSSASQQAKSPA